MATRPPNIAGLRHVALFVKELEACLKFYVDLLGMEIEWQPDDNNVYLSSGNDNLALHRVPADWEAGEPQHLDHIGFILKQAEDVDAWYEYFKTQSVKIKTPPKTHRDGARSFYCFDPAGIQVQMIYHPPIADR